jgi:3-isopropylmalate/(R)-2-methylmalate dehydratase small subunit
LFASIKSDHGTKVRVDVPRQTVTNLATGRSEEFELNPYKKYCLMNALDDIDYLLMKKDRTEAFERNRQLNH